MSLLESLQSHCRLPPAAQLTPIGGLECRLELFLSTAASLALSLRQAVEFAKRLPGFLLLPSLIQLHLVKANSLKLVLLCDLLLDGTLMSMFPAAQTTMPTANTSSPAAPLITFLDGRYLISPQAEALFSRDFVSDYSRLKAHCRVHASGFVSPTVVALLAAGLLLELPPTSTTSGEKIGGDLAALRGLTAQVAAATAALVEHAQLESVTSEVLSGVSKAAQEMRDFFKIFQSFCDNRQLPPVFVEVFDF